MRIVRQALIVDGICGGKKTGLSKPKLARFGVTEFPKRRLGNFASTLKAAR
jgi:hypothetical protein